MNANRPGAEKFSIADSRIAVAIHALVVFVFAIVYLPHHDIRMFNGLDGHAIRILVRDYWLWAAHGTDLNMNMFEGMGNVFRGSHLSLVPAYALQQIFQGAEISPVLAYAIFSVELFFSAYIWASWGGMSRVVCISAGWLLVFLALPFMYIPLFDPLFQMAPHIVDLLFFSTLFLYCLNQLGNHRFGVSLILILAIVTIPSYMTVSNPLLVMIVIPTTVVVAIYITLWATDKRSRLLRASALGASVGCLLAGGFVAFLYGNTFYTATAFFANEYVSIQNSLHHASIAFQGPAYRMGPVIFAAGMIGSALAIWRQRGRQRYFAILFLSLATFYLSMGIILIRVITSWRGPNMSYFETSLWPGYAAYAAFAMATILNWLWRAIARQMNWGDRMRSTAGLLIMAFSVPLSALLVNASAGERPGASAINNYPPGTNSIIDVLRTEASLTPDGPFRGYVATFTGTAGKSGGIDHLDQHAFDQGVLVPRFNNDHRYVGLRYFHIPTFQEDSQYNTPPHYLLASRFLARPGDRQVRNIILLTKPDLPLLRSFGVSFIITDQALESNQKLRASELLPDGRKLLLYELSSVNLGTYSPTKILEAATASEIVAAMKKGFDAEKVLLVSEPIDDALVPALEATMTVSRDGVRIRAKSKKTSSIVVPIQFSRCVQASFTNERPEKFSLLRANLVDTAIIFSGNLDVTLQLRNGPLGNSFCRIKDIEDMRHLEIQKTPSLAFSMN